METQPAAKSVHTHVYAKPVDDLRSALTLATDEELGDLAELLFEPKFNPLDYVMMPRPVQVQGYDRPRQITVIEQRFRFLAADGFTVLTGQSQRLEYRQILRQVCRHLRIPFTSDFQTIDLEAEILLVVLQKTCRNLSPQQYRDFNQHLQQALERSDLYAQLPETTRQEPLKILLAGGSILAIGSMLRSGFLRQLAQQWALQAAEWFVARQMLATGRGLLSLTGRGAAVNIASYSVIRSAFTLISPVLWGWLMLDLGWRSIAINYSRVIPFIFSIAQIRLTRS